MTTQDDATRRFMDDVAGDQKAQNQYRSPARMALKSGIRAAQAIQSPTPGASLGKVLLRTGIGALAGSSMYEKHAAGEEPDIHILDVYEKLNAKYGRSWWDWEPETVGQTLSYDFGIELGQDGSNIVGALQTVLNTNFAHELWHVFEKVGHAFNTNHVDFTEVQPLDLDEVALTLKILDRIRPQTEFESEVVGYMAAVAKSNGIVYLPIEWFPTATQEKLDTLGNDLILKGQVESLWNQGKKTSEDPLIENQLAALREIDEYVKPHLQGET